MKHILSLALAGLFCASAVQAQEVTGGTIQLGYSSFIGGGGNTDVNKLTLGSSLEYGFSQQFSVQGDFALMKYGLSNVDTANFGLHGIFHINDTTSVGGFIGQDRIEGDGLDYFGFEIGHQVGAIGTEAYISRADSGVGVKGTVLGIKGEYAVNEVTSVGARFDNINVQGIDASRFALTGEVAATPGLALTGELGQARIETLGSEAYIGVGVKVNFGAKRGATFDRRSIVDLLPGG